MVAENPIMSDLLRSKNLCRPKGREVIMAEEFRNLAQIYWGIA